MKITWIAKLVRLASRWAMWFVHRELIRGQQQINTHVHCGQYHSSKIISLKLMPQHGLTKLNWWRTNLSFVITQTLLWWTPWHAMCCVSNLETGKLLMEIGSGIPVWENLLAEWSNKNLRLQDNLFVHSKGTFSLEGCLIGQHKIQTTMGIIRD